MKWMVALPLVMGCGGYGYDDAFDPHITVFAYDDGDTTTPDVVVSKSERRIEMWWSGTTGFVEAAVNQSADRSAEVRVFLEPESGDLRMMYDASTDQTTVVLDDADSEDIAYYITFDAGGAWLDAHMVWLNGEGLWTARIVGVPAFEGQVYGQLEASSGQTGSFAVSPVATPVVSSAGALVLDDITLADPGAIAFAEGLAELSGGVTDPRMRVNFPKTFKTAGAIAIGAAAAGVAAPAWGAAGVAMVAVGMFAPELGSAIHDRFSNDLPVAGAAVEMLVDWLGGEGSACLLSAGVCSGPPNLTERFNDVTSGYDYDGFIEEVTDFLPDDVGVSFDWDDVADGAQTLLSDAKRFESDLYDGLNEVVTDVEGFAVWQDGTTFEVEGTIDPDGTVQLTGTSDDDRSLEIKAELDGGGTLEGTFDLDTDSGEATGETARVGDCSAAVASGGEGTFSFAHYVGVGPGTVSFFYDAYRIPDRFEVFGPGGSLFSTGGIVSGAQTVPLDIAAEGPVTLFVIVSAPESGTAWEYNLGCVQ